MHFKREADLQAMCLNVIADNIKAFVRKYPKWDEMKKTNRVQLEFLRRVYPDKLYTVIKKRDLHISNGIIDLLLTPNWKKVRLHKLNCIHLGLFQRLKIMGKTITSLNLKDLTASSDMLTAIICCVPNVVYLNLVGTECNDSAIALISKTCKSLESLNLGECLKVTDIGIAYLFNLDSKEIGFNSLKALNINGTEVTEKSIPLILKYLTSLKYLKYGLMSLVLYDLYSNAMINGRARYNLTTFEYDLWNIPFDLRRYENMCAKRVMELWTVLCPQVTRIYVVKTVDEGLIQLCSKFEHLKVLKLFNEDKICIELTKEKFLGLKASQLTEIHLEYVSISMSSIVELCSQLKKLTLDKVLFEEFDVSTLSLEEVKLNKLESFTLKHVDLKNVTVYKSLEVLLCFSKNLVKLSIKYSSHFGKNVAECILKSPNITTLNFNFTDIKLDILSMFFASENITGISTDGCPHIPRKCKLFTSIHDNNPWGNTCAWKINLDFFDDSDDEPSGLSWAEELSI